MRGRLRRLRLGPPPLWTPSRLVATASGERLTDGTRVGSSRRMLADNKRVSARRRTARVKSVSPSSWGE